MSSSQHPVGADALTQQCIEFNAFNIVSVKEKGKCVNASPLITNEPMMTQCVLEGVGRVNFECDTAASHSVLS